MFRVSRVSCFVDFLLTSSYREARKGSASQFVSLGTSAINEQRLKRCVRIDIAISVPAKMQREERERKRETYLRGDG